MYFAPSYRELKEKWSSKILQKLKADITSFINLYSINTYSLTNVWSWVLIDLWAWSNNIWEEKMTNYIYLRR